MKSGELKDKMPVLAEKIGNIDVSNSSNDLSQKNSKALLSPYRRLMESLQFDSKVHWELALGKRVGFYTLKGELGSGNFSRVKAGVHALTKEKVAIKILDKKKMDKKTKRLLCREISSMEKLHHPNIVHLYEVIHTEAKLYLVMEYACGGELFTKLSTQGMMNENDGKIIFSQILSAVQHMHQHDVIHRDLKAENVFYTDKKHVKVGDFGFSTEAKSTNQPLNTFCGSPPYAAPELFRDSFYYGESVDVWALGIMLYFIVTGTMPFRADTVGKLKKRILSGDFSVPDHVSSSCRNLIRSILNPNSKERFTTSDIKSSDWLANVPSPQPMGYYRLEPTKIDLRNCRPEEEYALYYLEKLGLGQKELKKFRFPSSGNCQSPFSWDARSDAMNTQLTVKKSLFAGSRSSQSNMIERLEINESSSVVGTYRIVLLQAQRRLSGPNASAELNRLRSLRSSYHSKQPIGHDDNCDWLCPFCETESNHNPSSTLLSVAINESIQDVSSSNSAMSSSVRYSSIESHRTNSDRDFISCETGLGTERNKRKNTPTFQNRQTSVIKSKFCTLL